MDVKHQEETDKGAEKYLKHVHKLHQTQREYLFKKHYEKEVRFNSYTKQHEYKHSGRYVSSDKAAFMKTCLPLKIEIINTDANQLNFHHELK